MTPLEVLQVRTMLALRFHPKFVADAYGVKTSQLWNATRNGRTS